MFTLIGRRAGGVGAPCSGEIFIRDLHDYQFLCLVAIAQWTPRRTGLAISTQILDIRINVLLKYLTAAAASSAVLYPTYPIRLLGISFASVTAPCFAKCDLKSVSVNFGGSPRTKMRVDLEEPGGGMLAVMK